MPDAHAVNATASTTTPIDANVVRRIRRGVRRLPADRDDALSCIKARVVVTTARMLRHIATMTETPEIDGPGYTSWHRETAFRRGDAGSVNTPLAPAPHDARIHDSGADRHLKPLPGVRSCGLSYLPMAAPSFRPESPCDGRTERQLPDRAWPRQGWRPCAHGGRSADRRWSRP